MVGLTYTVLELGEVGGRQGVSLGHDRNEVDASAQALHNFNVERLQGVSSRADEVKTGVHAEIDLLCSPRLLLLKHVALMLVVQELDDGLPAVTVVDVVTETGCVNDGQTDFEELLLQLGLGNLDLDSLVDLLGETSAVIGVVFDGGAEKGVDKGCLAETRLASDHDGESSASLSDNLVTLVGELEGV
jgi:hypothetical protein